MVIRPIGPRKTGFGPEIWVRTDRLQQTQANSIFYWKRSSAAQAGRDIGLFMEGTGLHMRGSSKARTHCQHQHNISYVDPKLPRPTLRQALRHYIVSAVIYGGILLLFRVSPWFSDLLGVRFCGYRIWLLYCYAYGAYLLIGGLIFFIVRPRSLWVSKNLRVAGYFGQLAQWCIGPTKRQNPDSWRPTYEQKQAMMFLLVKIFYGPLMVNSAIMGYNEIVPLMRQIRAHQFLLNYFDTGYLLFVSVIFLVDSLLFTVGYHTESGLLKNKLRFVETNPLHIMVCVACYPPFNRATIAFFGPSNRNPYILFGGSMLHPMTWVMRGLAMLFLVLLISSSLALFTKASNLTNRGIVTCGPYRFIRHPGYLAKNMFWIMTLIPVFFTDTTDPRFTWPSYLLFCAMSVAGVIGWGTIYFLRSITEEKFLMRDPDYVEYCKKVKYRFIPGVY